ncbi:MAG: pyruvate kinase alpha/beta domain-containing protein, partial [Desulfomicrobium sp.]|nr:pyruvate kinase alpha/beta domain-containing protein [Desulfomicrobium sp.]
EAVAAMDRVCIEAEKEYETEFSKRRLSMQFSRVDESIAMATTYLASHLKVKAIAALTESGATPLMMSRIYTDVPIYALSSDVGTRRKLTLFRGVYPVNFRPATQEREQVLHEAEDELRRRGAVRDDDLIIITIGVSILIRGLAMLLWGKDTHVLEPFSGNQPIMFLGAAIMPQAIWVLAISLFLLAALKLFFSGTIHGKAMLACSFDSKAASLVGIGVQRMVLLSFMISAFVGAVGGVILAPITMTSYDVGIMLGLKGFAACILGGLGNPFGAAAGGLILGVLESMGAGFVSSAYKDALAFVILLILLFVKPSGLFGPKDSKRV